MFAPLLSRPDNDSTPRPASQPRGGSTSATLAGPGDPAFRPSYSAFLERVSTPSRYTGGEYGVRPKDWQAVRARVCLAFPDLHEVGTSHLGLRILYRVLNDHPESSPSAALPRPDLEAELGRHGCRLVSLETARPLRDFDVVGFSLQFELACTNVLAMLELGGIPRRAAERGDDDRWSWWEGRSRPTSEPLAAFIDRRAGR